MKHFLTKAFMTILAPVRWLLSAIPKWMLSIASILLLILILILLAIQTIAVWLSTSSGEKWVERKIETSLKDAPYQVSFDGIELSFLGISTPQLRLFQNDSDEAFLHSKNLKLSVHPFLIFSKRLDVSLSADKFYLDSVPSKTEATTPAEQKAPFNLAVPNIFFKTIDLEIDIDDLKILNNPHLGFEWQETVRLSTQSFDLEGAIEVSQLSDTPQRFFPQEHTHTISLDAKNNLININDFNLINDIYDISSQGSYNIDTKDIGIEIDGLVAEPTQITPQWETPIETKFALNGTLNNFEGGLEIDSRYKDTPLNINIPAKGSPDTILIENISGAFSALSLSGNIDIDRKTYIANGGIELAIDSLADLPKNLLDVSDLSGAMSIKARLAGQETQALTLSATASNIIYDDLAVRSVKVSTKTSDITDILNSTVDLDANVITHPITDIRSINATTRISKNKLLSTLKLNGYSYAPYSVKATAATNMTAPYLTNIDAFKLTLGDGTVALSGSLSQNEIDLNINARDIASRAVPFVNLSSVPAVLDNAKATIAGPMSAPNIELNYDIRPVNFAARSPTIHGRASLKETKAKASVDIEANQKDLLNANITAPLSLSLYPFALEIDKSSPLSGIINANADVSVLAQAFLPETLDVSGQFTSQGSIGGTIGAPQIDGQAQYKNGTFTHREYDVKLYDIEGRVTYDQSRIQLVTLTANDNENGTLNSNADVTLPTQNAPLKIDAALKINNMHLLKGADYNGWISTDIKFEDTNQQDYLLSGTMKSNKISIAIPESFDTNIPKLNIIESTDEKGSFADKIRLDLGFKADNKIFVTGWGLDTEFKGDLAITGYASSPLVNGRLETIRGRYEEFGRRFTLDHARIRFDGEIPPSPYLDIQASTDIEDIEAFIKISGASTKPKLDFSSIPSLPKDEVLSHILFGKELGSISAFQAVQLTRTLRRLSGQGGGFDAVGAIKDVTGLDDIRVDSRNGETRVGAGKYINDRVYLDVEKGASEDSGAITLDIEITPNVSAESITKQTGENETGVFWEWRY